VTGPRFRVTGLVLGSPDPRAPAAGFQPQEHVRVYLDPDSHPFCLWVAEPA
jgi:hypothetical protein